MRGAVVPTAPGSLCISCSPGQQPLHATPVSAEGLTPFAPFPFHLHTMQWQAGPGQPGYVVLGFFSLQSDWSSPVRTPERRVSLSPAVRPGALASEQGTSPLLTPQAAG